MSEIALLDQKTIDKIAAGEVIERPASVVKELVENSIDAGASAVTVEIKEGGISFLRVTDNGNGIPSKEVALAFLRHSTSKIRAVEDLFHVSSLGFRGEALSSIAAIAMVELITKTNESQAGTRYVIEGGQEKKLEEMAAPKGSTFLVRNLFYNTPARRKFLKSPLTEAGYISSLMERLALSHPEISFQFINNGQTKLHTSGNGNLKDVIYHVYGREIAANLAWIDAERGPVKLTGFIGKPVISRGNRSYENYFINGRYIKSKLISKGIEDAYRTFLMQRKYPFTVLHFSMSGELLDVNVHPTKMELRFSNQEEMYRFVQEAVRDGLTGRELIPEVKFTKENKEQTFEKPPEQPFKQLPREFSEKSTQKPLSPPVSRESQERTLPQEKDLAYFMEEMKRRVTEEFREKNKIEEKTPLGQQAEERKERRPIIKEEPSPYKKKEQELLEGEQLELFTPSLLNPATKSEIRIIGQLFETYWLVQFEDKFYMIDQHAAHEKVLYERILKSLALREMISQLVSPPLILTLTSQEAGLLEEHRSCFTELGFEIEPFGGKEYAVSAVPANLLGIAEKELFLELLDSLEGVGGGDSRLVLEKIASMSCKGAVKGSSPMSSQEAKALIEELLKLENPYNCPHGRPTIISMTKQEIEKKFRRIV